MRASLFSLVIMTSLAIFGCGDCGGEAYIGDGDGGVGGSGGNGGNGGNGGSGGNGGNGGSGAGTAAGQGGAGAEGGGSCGAVSQQATLEKKPVDIIFVIDNSCSMQAEIEGVQDNINQNFAQVIGASGLDYRVIMLSRHGASSSINICISAPLSGNGNCMPPPAQPVNTANFFHYSQYINSTDSLRRIISAYPMYQQWLRPNAYKVFVEVTDDNETGLTPANFETQLFALNPSNFGSAQNRNYVFHSITGIVAKSMPADAYQPNEPVATARCPSGVNAGATYQNLSILTGGLRFPVCTPSLFNTVFRKTAEGVVAGSQVACEFSLPPVPPGYTTVNKVYVNYTPMGTGTVQSFTRATSAAACGPNQFYMDANNRVILCPDTCTTVKADSAAKVEVVFTCEPDIN